MRTRVTVVRTWGTPQRPYFLIKLQIGYGQMVSTTDPFLASLADQACKQGKDVDVQTTRHPGYPDRVTGIQILDEQRTA